MAAKTTPEKLDAIRKACHNGGDDALKLIHEWVKTGHLSFREHKLLIMALIKESLEKVK